MRSLLDDILKVNSRSAALNFDSSYSKEPPEFNLTASTNDDNNALNNGTEEAMSSSNYNHFNTFSSLPNNIAEYGINQDEIKLNSGSTDPNPVLSPMKSNLRTGSQSTREEIVELRAIIDDGIFPVNFSYTMSGSNTTVTLNDKAQALSLLKELELKQQIKLSLRRENKMNNFQEKLSYLRKQIYAKSSYQKG